MRAWILRLVLLAVALPSVVSAAFVQSGEAGYEALKTASDRVGDRGWVAERLRKGEPLSEMVAKEEAKVLLLNKQLDPAYLKAIKDAFPQETEPVEEKYAVVDERVKVLDDQVNLVTAKLDRFEAGMRDGLLSGRSRPSLLGSMGGGLLSAGNYHGPGKLVPQRSIGTGATGIWTEWSTADDGFLFSWVMMFYPPAYIDFTTAQLSLFFDNPFLPGVEAVLVNDQSYPALSLLIFNGGGDGFDDDFYKMGELSGRKELIKSGPGYGARGAADIYLRRKSEGDWWPFSDTQFVATQTGNYFYGNLNDVATSFKIRGLPMFWPFERADPVIATLWTFGDAADIHGYGDKVVPENSSAQSFAVNMLVVGGGTFYLEAATAEWQKSDVDKSFRDIAVATILSKSIGKTAFVLDYQHTGPNFYPGGSEGASNAASSFYPENRPGRGDSGWDTLATNSGPASNTEHLGVGATVDLGSASLGFTLGTNMQIEPSGPWLRSRHMIGWPWDRLGTNNGGHGLGTPVDANEYNKAFPKDIAVTDSLGNTLQVDWTSLDSYNRETILLTKTGVGDKRLRDDSVKYVNFVDLLGDINFQSLFDMERPCLLKYSSRLRNTEESFAFPTLGTDSFLMQIASSLTLNVSLPKKLQVVTAVGYEDWASLATFRPIEFHTAWVFFEFFKEFPEFLSGFSVGPQIAIIKHQNPNNSYQDFSEWQAGIGASTTF
jgi:hypothetical protein